jgi:hypothetical protein
MNSIITNKGSKGKGQPAGTNKEKNFKPCLENPNIVAPNTIVKLRAKVKAKCPVDAKLYGQHSMSYRLTVVDYILIP